MAVLDDIDTELTLEIDGRNVTPEMFLKSVDAFFGLLKAVTQDVCRNGDRVSWRVQVKAGSNLVGVAPTASSPFRAVNSITEIAKSGIQSLESKAEKPAGFPAAALEYARDLGKLVGTGEHSDTTIRLWRKKESISLSRNSVTHADELLKQAFVEDHGSVEGHLEMATRHDSKFFRVYESIWGKSIKCFVGDGLLEEALDHFGKRVEVYGLIRYRKDGTPVSVKVEEIVPFPDPLKIPDYKDVKGILRKYT